MKLIALSNVIHEGTVVPPLSEFDGSDGLLKKGYSCKPGSAEHKKALAEEEAKRTADAAATDEGDEGADARLSLSPRHRGIR